MEWHTSSYKKQHADTEFVVSPFQYLWIKPQVTTSSMDAFEAVDIVRGKLECIETIEVIGEQHECAFSQVKVDTLEVSCPHCAEGKHQELDFKQWEYLLDWREEEIKGLMEAIDRPLPDSRSLEFTDDDACKKVVRDVNNELSLRCCATDVSSKLEEVVGKTIAKKESELSDFNPAQLHLQIPGIPSRRVFRLQSTLFGLYRCPYCEETFAIFFPGDNAYLSFEAACLVRAIMNFIDRIQQWNCVGISSDRRSVLLEIKDDPNALILQFSTDDGTAKLNGFRVTDAEALITILSDLRVDIKLFSDHELLNEVAERLPSFPDKAYWSHDGLSNLRLLLLANRFIGYPPSFYRQLMIDSRLFSRAYPLDSGIPRYFEDIDRAYEMTGLPHKKSIRSRVFKDPVKLLKIIVLRGLPFENVDVINSFLDDRGFDRMTENIMIFRGVAERIMFFWRELARIKGETAVLRFFQTQSRTNLELIQREVGREYWPIDSWARDAIGKASLSELPKSLPFIRWASENPWLDLDERFQYAERQRNLEGEFGGVRFKLPSSAREYVEAGLELHNCMGSLPARLDQNPEETHVLIMNDSSYVGGITVTSDGKVIEARGACNEPLMSNPNLWSAFCKWQEFHGLEISKSAQVM